MVAQSVIDFDAEVALKPIEPLLLTNGGGTLTPRDYQIEAVAAVYQALRDKRSTLAVLATGLGKTVIAAEIALLWPEECGRVLFIAHRKELIQQGAKSIGLHLDEECGIEMADRSEAREGASFHGRSKVLVGSVQTLSRLNRLKPYHPDDFGLIIFDEAHHATSGTYKTIMGWFQQNRQCRFLGITATPDRADGALLGEVFESVAFEMDILAGINNGWLVPVHQRFVVIEGLDFSACRTTAGDLNERDLERVMAGANADELGDDDANLTDDQIEARRKQENLLHEVAGPTIREADGRPGIVFCVTCDHAEKMAAVFRRYDVTAECVTQRTNPDERAEHIANFKAGRLQFLVGVGVFTEGFDAPNAAVIAMARPTKSRALYSQCIGRATRPDPASVKFETPDERKAGIAASGKPHCTVLDFVGNSGRHKLVSTADILGGAEPEDLREEVVEKMRRLGQAADIVQEMADLSERRERMRKIKEEEERQKREEANKRYQELLARTREEDRLRLVRAEAQYRTRDVDAFGNMADYQPEADRPSGGATEAQVRFLEALGVKHETALSYGRRQAGAVITALKAKRGGEYRITFGKHKGKSLAEAGNGFVWWIENVFAPTDENGLKRKQEITRNIELWKLEKQGVSVPAESPADDRYADYF